MQKIRRNICVLTTLCLSLLSSIRAQSTDDAIVEMCPYSSSLTEIDLAHGREQLEKMLIDRPRIAPCLKKRQSVCDWIARQFAGEYTGSKIFWRDSDYLSADGNVLSSYTPSEPGQSPTIAVLKTTNKGDLLEGELICARLVFELFNIRNGKAYKQAALDAKARKLTKNTFVLTIAQQEYDAEKQTVHFYDRYWNHSTRNPELGSSRKSYWYKPLPPNFESWISQFTDKSSYPWSTYSIRYDLITR